MLNTQLVIEPVPRQKEKRIAIPLSRGKLLMVLLGAIAFVIGCVFLWVLPNPANRSLLLLCRIGAVAGALFSTACGVYAAIKMFDSKPGLIIDSKGLIDNSSGLAVGRIPWRDIVDVRVLKAEFGTYLVIDVRNPKSYAGRGNAFKRLINAGNMKMVGSPIAFDASTLRITFDKLVDLVESAFERHTGRREYEYDEDSEIEDY